VDNNNIIWRRILRLWRTVKISFLKIHCAPAGQKPHNNNSNNNIQSAFLLCNRFLMDCSGVGDGTRHAHNNIMKPLKGILKQSRSRRVGVYTYNYICTKLLFMPPLVRRIGSSVYNNNNNNNNNIMYLYARGTWPFHSHDGRAGTRWRW